ncbi:uncharacterized protein LOC125216936 [Salvia hispanica]|uniref:uncharacterized protein LOC125216936 n=1 Tax=Salvia hispanica TaxID=49212 RepID=UPI0020096323|nr:uncharacterized protein LOC125216936 [Salvia hispanica]
MSSTSFLQTFDPFSKARSSSRSIKRPRGLMVRVMRREARGRGRRVDEDMIVLRKRIHEMKMNEEDCELPREWMEWERRVYVSYDAIVCDAVGRLQAWLMDTRPGVALGVLVLLALSVPTSTAVVMYNLVAVLSGIRLG